ncbi:MAG: hypothetical protein LH491_10010, partial [Pseudoxanthomonas sp.]|nr:hypothetical protein [Pseudoxanthomonas sp.]
PQTHAISAMSARSGPRNSQRLLLLAAGLCAAAAMALGFHYLVYYWPYRDRFDAQGRYFDEATLVVYQQQSGMLLLPMLACLLLAVVLAVFWWRRHKRLVAGTGQG